MRLIALALMGLLIASKPSLAISEAQFQSLLDGLHTEIRPQVMANRPSVEQNRAENTKIEIITDPFARGLALADKGNNKIVFSTGFLWGLYMYSEAFLIEKATGLDHFREMYFNYFLWRHPAFWDGEVSKPPGSFFGLSDSKVDSILHESTLTVEMLFSAAVVEVYLHELGHIAEDAFYSANSANSTKREKERIADAWATRASADMNDQSGIGKLIALGYLNELERFAGTANSPYRSHPAVSDRFASTVDHWCSQSGATAKQVCDLYKQERNETFNHDDLYDRYVKRKDNGERFATLKIAEMLMSGKQVPQDTQYACVNYVLAYVGLGRRDQAAMNYAWCLGHGHLAKTDVAKAKQILAQERDRGWLDAQRLLNDLN